MLHDEDFVSLLKIMEKKIIYTFFFAILLSPFVYGQPGNKNGDDYVANGDEYVVPFDSLKTKDKLHYNFGVGAEFGHSNTFGNYFSTFYRPSVSYDVSSRFSLNTGLTYVNSSVDNFPVLSDYSYHMFSGNIAQYYAFVGGKYKVTDKLSVGGSVFYDFTSYHSFDGKLMDKSSGLDNLGYSANFQYKVAKNLLIEGEIRVNDKNPYHSSSSFSTGFMGDFEGPFFSH